MNTTPDDRQPLWLAMQDAGFNAEGTPCDAIAAEIEAVRDWLEDAFGDELPTTIYNCLTLYALEARCAEEDEPPTPSGLQRHDIGLVADAEP
jgi:hypothetical protein